MKVGILTFHNAHNYGAALQAYALKTKIQEMGRDAEIINYRNPTIESNYQKQLSCKFEWTDLLHPGRVWFKLCYKRNIKYMQPQWTNQYDRFEEFIQQYLLDMPEVEINEIGDMGYEILIVGSDQIWTEELTGGLDRAYVLDLPYQGRRVSYAGSTATGKIPKREAEFFVRCIKKFDYVSAREDALAADIRKAACRQAQVALDPTLLLDKENYQFLEKEERLPFLSMSYVFVYYVKEDEQLKVCAEKIADEMGIKTIELHYFFNKKYHSEYQFADFGPGEFLAAIAHAEFVVTNSFHGTVFSILYQKDFYSVYRENNRIQTLLENLGIEQRHIDCMEKVKANDPIPYCNVMEKLKIYRKTSIQFLKQALIE